MIDRFRLFLNHEGLTIVSERDVQGGKQLVVTDEHSVAHCTFYDSGTILVQGRESPLKNTLSAWAGRNPDKPLVGMADFPAGWREWYEPIDWLNKYIKKNGFPSDNTAGEKFKILREMLFHDYMMRKQGSAVFTAAIVEYVVKNWLNRFCFMGLDHEAIVAQILEHTDHYSFKDGEFPLDIIADGVSGALCTHCPRKFIKEGNKHICPQVKSDQNGCASQIVDALYPFSSAKKVVAYTKTNLERFLSDKISDINWYDFEPSSPLEVAMESGLRSAGLIYVPQYQAYDDEHKYKIDFVIKTEEGPRLAIECDGLEFHARPDVYIRDRKRDRYLQKHGFYVMRFSSIEIFKKLDSVVEEIDEAFWRLRKGKLKMDEQSRTNYFGYNS